MMLDNNKQIKAFKILNASGLVTPDSVTFSLSAATEAKAIGESLIASVDEDLTYPETVTKYIAEIEDLNEAMESAAIEAERFADAITPFSSPSELLQMRLGWDCYVKGNEISPTPAFWLVEGIEDKVVAAGLFEALQMVNLGPVTAAMTAINTTLVGGTVLLVPDEQVLALSVALADLKSEVVVVKSAATLLSQLTTDVTASTGVSKKALEDAVNITLTNNLITDALMSGAIVQIMPAGVIAALSEEEL